MHISSKTLSFLKLVSTTIKKFSSQFLFFNSEYFISTERSNNYWLQTVEIIEGGEAISLPTYPE